MKIDAEKFTESVPALRNRFRAGEDMYSLERRSVDANILIADCSINEKVRHRK